MKKVAVNITREQAEILDLIRQFNYGCPRSAIVEKAVADWIEAFKQEYPGDWEIIRIERQRIADAVVVVKARERGHLKVIK